MEHGEEHECAACARGRNASVAQPGRWSRRRVLQLGAAGAAAGVGAAALRMTPALAGTPGAIEREAAPSDAAVPPAVLAPDPSVAVPSIITRAQWGANEAHRKPGQLYNSRVEKLVVHHTVTPNNPSDPAAVVNSVYEYDVNGVYIDVCYHFLIDAAGRVYEGRWARDYPAGAAHTGENALQQNVQGAATLGHNPNTISVAMLGTFTDILPTDAAMNSLVTVLAWKCARWGISPLGATPYTDTDDVTQTFPDIIGHRSVVPTICPGDPLISRLSTIRQQVYARMRNGTFGYWIATANGHVGAYGDVPDVGSPYGMGLTDEIRGIAAHPSRLGYWAVGVDGGIFTFGNARFYGSMGGTRLNRPVIGMAPTPSGNGYWLLASDGGIFSFGDAQFHGSTGAIHLNRPVIAMAPTPSGRGYWLLASDGGIFCFGDAQFHGSTGAIRLAQPIVAMTPTPTGRGYWLLARDGGVFCFGDANFFGSGPQRGMRAPAVAMLPTTSGRGYAIVGTDGTVLPFGDARSYGNATGLGPVVGFAGRLLPT
jgi:hypothetical protein